MRSRLRVLPDAERGTRDRTESDDYAEPRIDRLRVTRWRVRVAFAVVPVGWLLMGDTSAFLVACIGAAAFAAILASGSWLARLEERADRMHRAARRWR